MADAGEDPWGWLLGRTPGGSWRHVPHQALDLGQGQDPTHEPRVEVIHRLIAYPTAVFDAVLAQVRALDARSPERPIRWLCYREPGQAPSRPYWLCFVTARPGGRRFHFGLELFDRHRLGLWLLSGYDAASVPQELRAPFPSRPDVSLPRLELDEAALDRYPVAAWLADAWDDRLVFSRPTGAGGGTAATPRRTGSYGSADQSHVLDASVVGLTRDGVPGAPDGTARVAGDFAVGARAAKARLVVCPPGGPEGEAKPKLHPLARLEVTLGRDPHADVVLEHRSVSMEHARIGWHAEGPALEDLGSKNGTKLDGQPVPQGAPRPLPLEARLELGEVPCLFIRDPDRPDPKAPPRHDAKVKALVARKRLTPEQAQSALEEAAQRGITPGEVLLTRRLVGLDEWAPPKGSCALWLLWLALACSLAGCGSFALPPFYEQDLEPQPMREGTRRVEWDFDVGLRPLFAVRAEEATDRLEAHLLFPLAVLEKTPTQTWVRAYPFYQRIQRTDPDGFADDDTFVFPVLLTGTHPVEGDYLFVFPFGGRLRGLLGLDEAVAVLFPLYAWTRQGESRTHHVLWPLIAHTSGGRTEGLRVLPFYGHKTKRDAAGEVVFDRTTVLWPLLSWANDRSNARNPFESFVLFPLVGWTRSGWRDETTVLWPLFRHLHDKQRDYREWRLPFPFFLYGAGPDDARLDVWPLFGVRRRGDYTRHFVLWPLERRETFRTDEWEEVRQWVLPLFWYHQRDYLDGRGRDLTVNVLPFVRVRDRHDGAFEVAALAPWWFDDPNENFQTLLEPLVRLFRWARDAEGHTRLDVLLGLYSRRTSPDGASRWDILGGLVGHETRPSGEGVLRLLWFLEL